MKRKTTRLLIGLISSLILLSLCYLLWPHSFADLQPECDSITLFRIDIADDFSQVITKETYTSEP